MSAEDVEKLSKPDVLKEYRSKNPDADVGFTSNEEKEETVMKYVNQFLVRARNNYPQLPPMLLISPNEYGQNKFISTYISPTLIPFQEIYEVSSCSKFLSDLIDVRPLDDLNKIPDCIQSPVMTLKTQTGDAFDLSIVLCSLLLGAGYDAYVAYGIVRNDLAVQSSEELFYKFDDDLAFSSKSFLEEDEDLKVEEEKEPKYKLKLKPSLKSKFVEEKIEKEKLAKEALLEKSEKNKDDNEENSGIVWNVHCWVVVFPGKRGVEKITFIDTPTGEMKNVNEITNEYKSVHALFNHQNYWLNMNTPNKVSDLTFDLSDRVLWEAIFFKHLEQNRLKSKKERLEEEIIDVPISWCGTLYITREQFHYKFPKKRKTERYRNAIVRRSSPFFEKDMSVRKVELFKNEAGEIAVTHMFFEKRKDKLQRRSEFFDENGDVQRIIEVFEPGRCVSSTEFEGLIWWERIIGDREIFRFSPSSRIDGLNNVVLLRENGKVRKTVCMYSDRSDFLNCQTWKFDLVTDRIVKRTERYERNIEKDADDDIEKMIFTPKKYKVLFHFSENKITRSMKEYILKTMHFSMDVPISKVSKVPTEEKALDFFKHLQVMRKRCEDSIDGTIKNIEEIVKRRETEEENVRYRTSIYDTLQNRPTEKEMEILRKRQIEEEMMKKKDVLRGFIPEGGVHDRETALKVYHSVLNRTRNRILSRTKIMESRLKEEKALMNKKRIQYQKQDNTSQKKEEEFLKYWEKTMFKMEILKQRCEINQVEAKNEYERIRNLMLGDLRLKNYLKEERKKFSK